MKNEKKVLSAKNYGSFCAAADFSHFSVTAALESLIIGQSAVDQHWVDSEKLHLIQVLSWSLKIDF
jgi:hypothetical protein